MGEQKRPKRRRDKYNPYTLSQIGDKHFVSFRVRYRCIISIMSFLKPLFLLGLFYHQNRQRILFLKICNISPYIKPSKSYLKHKGAGLFYIILGGLNYSKIAKGESCSKVAVKYSIDKALHALRDFLK